MVFESAAWRAELPRRATSSDVAVTSNRPGTEPSENAERTQRPALRPRRPSLDSRGRVPRGPRWVSDGGRTLFSAYGHDPRNGCPPDEGRVDTPPAAAAYT